MASTFDRVGTLSSLLPPENCNLNKALRNPAEKVII